MRLSLVPLVLAVVASPASGLTVAGGPQGTPGDDASMCFTYAPAGLVVGVATATGVVRAASVDLDPRSFGGSRVSAPSTLVADVQPLATTKGYGTICVGGVGLRVVAGSVTFTFEAHTSTDSFAAVVTCTYGPSATICA